MACAHIDGSPTGCAAVFHGKLGALNSPIFVEKLDHVTCNEAEYLALLLALRQAQTYGARTLHIYSDSKILVKQVNLQYQVRAENLRRLHAQAIELIKQFELVVVQYIPRWRNKEADAHSR